MHRCLRNDVERSIWMWSCSAEFYQGCGFFHPTQDPLSSNEPNVPAKLLRDLGAPISVPSVLNLSTISPDPTETPPPNNPPSNPTILRGASTNPPMPLPAFPAELFRQ